MHICELIVLTWHRLTADVTSVSWKEWQFLQMPSRLSPCWGGINSSSEWLILTQTRHEPWPKWSHYVYTLSRQLKVSKYCPLSHCITLSQLLFFVGPLSPPVSPQSTALCIGGAHFLLILVLQITSESLLAPSLAINHRWDKGIVSTERKREGKLKRRWQGRVSEHVCVYFWASCKDGEGVLVVKTSHLLRDS